MGGSPGRGPFEKVEQPARARAAARQRWSERMMTISGGAAPTRPIARPAAPARRRRPDGLVHELSIRLFAEVHLHVPVLDPHGPVLGEVEVHLERAVPELGLVAGLLPEAI